MKNKNQFLVPLLVVMGLMFMWNFCRNINDILIPHLKRACQLTDFQSSLIQSAFFGGYFLLALPVGKFIQKFGYKSGMITGLFVAAFGALLFFPAAETRNYTIFLSALFIMAAGFTFLEVTATPYVSILGDPEKASSRLSLAAAVGSIGATIGPFISSKFLLHTIDVTPEYLQALNPTQLTEYLNSEANLVKTPYLSLVGLFVVLGLLLFFIKLPKIEEEESKNEVAFKSIFKFKHTVLGALGVFCYLGAEVGIVSFLIRYAKSLNINDLGEQKAALFITLFMGLVLVGRLSGAYLLNKFHPPTVLKICAIGAVFLVSIAIVSAGIISILCLSFVGLFTSVMYPILFTLSIKNLGEYTKTGSSLIIMSIVGGAIIPPLMGLISDAQSIRFAFVLPLFCYVYIYFYAQKGYLQTENIKSNTL